MDGCCVHRRGAGDIGLRGLLAVLLLRPTHDRVTLATTLLKPFAIENRDATARVADKAGALQFPGADRHSLAPHAKQAGDAFLRGVEYAILATIVVEQQPSTKLLLDGVVAIASGGLRRLREQRLQEMHQRLHQRTR